MLHINFFHLLLNAMLSFQLLQTKSFNKADEDNACTDCVDTLTNSKNIDDTENIDTNNFTNADSLMIDIDTLHKRISGITYKIYLIKLISIL